MDPVEAAAQVSIAEPLDPEFTKKVLTSSPFYQIEGLINVRKLPLPHPDTTPNKRGIILRSGETARLTDLGKFQLRNLGITKIFDLRSAREIKRIQSPLQVEGIEVVHAPAMPLSRSENMQDVFVKFKYDEGEDPDAQFVVSYDDILKEAVAAFRLIFEHIRDRLPLGEGMLIHCTAGKDRTGVAVMLILGLIRLDRQTIAREYALTRIGLESGRESLLSRYKHILTNPETSQAACNVFSSRPSAMMATLVMLQDRYGGAKGYLRNQLGFSETDISQIEDSLLGRSSGSTE